MAGRWVVPSVVLALGCSGQDRSGFESGPEQVRELSGTVIAEFNGGTASLAELRLELREGAHDVNEALARVVQRKLLRLEANRVGFRPPPEAHEAALRSTVRQLLRYEVENAVTEESLAEDDLRHAFAAQEDRFRLKDRRTVSHLLFAVKRTDSEQVWEDAEERARHALNEAARQDPQDVFSRWESQPNVSHEDLGTFSQDAPFVRPFLDAAFSVDKTGVLPAPVHTSFGVHVLWIREVHSPTSMSYDEARPLLVKELIMKRRIERLAELVQRFRARHAPQFYDAALSALEDSAQREGSGRWEATE